MRKTNAKYNNPEWIGKRYGRLVVLEPIKIENNSGKQWFWKMRCDCGTEKIMKPYEIINGKNVSCGCYRKNLKTSLTHGESHTRLHNIWCGMNNRCNPNHVSSKGYGKRGIKICDEWKDYTKFAKWARENGFDDDLTIERIDVNGDYCPENCTWIPLAKQARNRRTTRWVEYKGRKMSLAEAAEIADLPYYQVHLRIKSGWSLEKALSTPIRKMKKRKTATEERIT